MAGGKAGQQRWADAEARELSAGACSARGVGGFTLLELMVTLLMVAMILVVVLKVLGRTEEETRLIHDKLQRELALDACLDQLCEDLRAAAAQDLLVMVQSEAVGRDQDSSRLVIQFRPAGAETNVVDKTIEWVSAPRYGGEDLLLFRRVKTRDNKTTTDYVPVCEGIHSFRVEEINDALLEITASIYRTDPPEPGAVFATSRTFCVERFRMREGRS